MLAWLAWSDTDPTLSYSARMQPSSSKAGKEDGEEEERVYDLSQLKPRAASEPAPGSSRGIMADLAGIRRFLGKKVPATGKQAVVDLLSPHQRAKFSK